MEQSLSHSLQKEPTLPIPQSQISSLQNCNTINFYGLSHQAYGTWLLQS